MVVAKILKGQYNPLPSHYSPGLQTLVRDLLQRDPTHRPSAAQLLQRTHLQPALRECGPQPLDPPAPRRAAHDSERAAPAARALAAAPAPQTSPTPKSGRPTSASAARATAPAGAPTPVVAPSNAQWMAQKLDEILHIQGDLGSKLQEPAAHRSPAARTHRGSQPAAASAGRRTVAAGLARACSAPPPPDRTATEGRAVDRLAARKEMYIRRRAEAQASRAHRDGPLDEGEAPGPAEEPPARGCGTQERERAKTGGRRARSPASGSSLGRLEGASRVGGGRPPRSREEVLLEKKQREGQREKERQLQRENMTRHRQVSRAPSLGHVHRISMAHLLR